MMQACPTEEELFLYLAGTLAESESDRVRSHVVTCATCRELVVLEARADGTPTPTLLAGKYAIERELGSGGMGRVLLARHVKLDKLVAIKMIHADFLRDPKVVERFTREARAAAALKSRHVVQVLDIDTAASGEPFIVMERLHGTDLDSKVLREGPLPLVDAVRYVREACVALAEAHDAGILHRDVKPANLFLADVDGGVPIVKILDFGLAKALPGGAFVNAEHTLLTAKSDLLGSPRFMSPEQFGGEVDHRTDIWSIGVTLYFLLSGELPFIADDLPSLRESIVTGALVPLATRRPDLPVGIVGAIERCLATRREDRWNGIRDFVLALGQPESDRAIERRGGARRVPFEIGRYTALRRIAAGGMGTVYLARSRGALGFSRPVAVKQLHSHLALDEAIRRRFLAEARVVSHIDHPHVVKVLDVVEDDGDVFLVLDYVHGETLHHLLGTAHDRSSPIDPAILSSIFGQSAEALHAAHEAIDENGEPLGLVHRDVSPHNVLVAKQGAAYITDFGIAKVAAQIADQQSGVMGKSGYMAPEQLRGETVSRRADVFALGVMLWEALARRRLFVTPEDRHRWESSPTATIPAPSSVRPDAPAELDALVLAMLARSPDARPATALAVTQRLHALVAPARDDVVGTWVVSLAHTKLEGLEIALAAESGPTSPLKVLAPAAELVTPTPSSLPRRSFVPWAAAAAAMVVLGVAAPSGARWLRPAPVPAAPVASTVAGPVLPVAPTVPAVASSPPVVVASAPSTARVVAAAPVRRAPAPVPSPPPSAAPEPSAADPFPSMRK